MIRVGKIAATHGIGGAMVFTHIVGSSQWIRKGGALFVEMNKGSNIPYFISSVKVVNNEEVIISVEEIDKVESAKRLVSKNIYVEESALKGFERQSPLLWIGFDLLDKKEGPLGKIEDVLQTGNQWIAKITYKDAEVLVPLIEQTIENLNIKTKKIQVTLPEGLLDVYLGL
jgi:16S rRNA processing protein RimM